MKKSVIIIVIIFLCFSLLSSTVRLRKLLIAGVRVDVEVADSPEFRETGLMYRTFLPENRGMLFTYNYEFIMHFWMKNTLIDLDIGFFDKNKILHTIKTMKKFDLTSTSSEKPSKYALEVNKDWFKRNNVTIGSSFKYLD